MIASGEHRAGGQFHRVAAMRGEPLSLSFDGQTIAAAAGQSVLSALLAHGRLLRRSEFGDDPRAGFCLMGACQDCWVWSQSGGRLRACTTPVAAGMILASRPVLPPHG
ncbi:(2Fe-2S)-binding protein [Bosea sp. NPDC055594]